MAKPVFTKKSNGPLQIVHDFRFTALNVKDDYSFLDTCSHEEKLSHMKKRVDSLYDKGYGGIVMNVDHIDYLDNEDSFLRVKEIALYAKNLGMKVWLYDEQYYPSGAAGGLVLKGHPELEAMALSCVSKTETVNKGEGAIRIPSPLGHSPLKFATAVPVINGNEMHEERIDISECRDIAGGLCFDAPVGEWKIYAFFVRTLFEATKLCQGTRASRRYVNIRDKKAIERFYDVTFTNGYEKLFDRLGDVVDGVFTDEPNTPLYISWKNPEKRTMFESFSMYDKAYPEIPTYPFVPWQNDVPALFKERFGYDLASVLVDIFFESDKTRKARCDFYTLLSDMSLEAFPKQMQDKLGKAGVSLSGHYYGEEAFDVQAFYYGDILEHLASMGIPGCDNLKSEADALRYCNACKLASSAAHIVGKDRVMIEASNMTDRDQNITPKIAKAAIDMMFVHGVNLITSYYGENIFDKDGMCEFTNHISNLATLFDGGKYCVDTFLYYPFEELCATLEPEGIVEIGDGFHDRFGIMETSKKLMQNRVTFDYINSRKLLGCKICDGFVLSPNGNKIYNIVIPNTGFIQNGNFAKYLDKAKENGVNVIFDREDATFDGISKDATLSDENPFITFMHKSFDGYDLYMFMNTKDEPFKTSVNIPCKKEDKFCLVNPDTLEMVDVTAETKEKSAEIPIEFSALSPVIICKY